MNVAEVASKLNIFSTLMDGSAIHEKGKKVHMFCRFKERNL